MQIFSVDGLCFDFPDDWLVTKYDDWAFYRKQFVRMWDGIKAVDLLALSPEGTLYLIEAKDYRRHRREKGLGIADEAAHKAFDTLAALLPAKIRAPDGPERDVAMRFLSAVKLQVVLHLEQPQTQSRLFPRIDPANVLQKLRQLVKPLDAHPVVAGMGRMGSLAGKWAVR
ncbi:MAG TPA: hypothetical protein PK535_08630 [Synergistaceae bacterium]|nr:hypothetical protein [Synergistaceae bacterium]HQH79018.1 hypothetical protein [Synergistaceae bacterium]